MKGILVLGPGRSGTSALTRIINLLGPSVCIPEDRMGPSPANRKGFWESVTVMIANELLLQLGGGNWRCLPPTESIGARVSEAVLTTLEEVFRMLHPFDEWLCKDPRFSITMPTWRKALGCDPVAVIAVRDPRQVATSYGRSFPTGPVDEAAVWERSLRSALVHAAGQPTIVAQFDRLLRGTETWCNETVDFLRRHGFTDVGPPHQAELDDFLDGDLFHVADSEASVSEEQRALFELAVSLVGHHDMLNVETLPRETPATAKQFDACLAARGGEPFPDRGSSESLDGGVADRTARIYNVVRAAYDDALDRAG